MCNTGRILGRGSPQALAVLAHKRATVLRLRDERRIDATVLRRVQTWLDIEEVRLSGASWSPEPLARGARVCGTFRGLRSAARPCAGQPGWLAGGTGAGSWAARSSRIMASWSGVAGCA